MSISTALDAVSKISQQIQILQAQYTELLAIADAAIAKTDYTGWFNRNRWLIHLARCNLLHLSQASRLPNKNEPTLSQAAHVVKRAVEQAVARLSTLSLETQR